MFYRFLADLLILVHLVFILFALLGGLTLLWRRWMVWIHLPCAVWACLIEFIGWVCPLTPLENMFRLISGEAGYQGGFIEHYLLPLIYPGGVTATIQFMLGLIALVVNVAVYSFVISRLMKKR
jgi:hypothetical protein